MKDHARAIEGAFIESFEGLIFDVKGLVHPPDRVIAFVRYYLHEKGDRIRSDGRRYFKLYDLRERYHFLEKYYPEVMENIKQKRKELVMENYIVLLENLYADVLGVERKWIPDHIQKLHDFDFKG